MDLTKLEGSPIGKLVPIEGHDEHLREFSYFAYLPDFLPESVELKAETWTLVASASEALGRLDQACTTLPNPRLLIAPALAREALDTSALEGTYGALADVLEPGSRNTGPSHRKWPRSTPTSAWRTRRSTGSRNGR